MPLNVIWICYDFITLQTQGPGSFELVMDASQIYLVNHGSILKAWTIIDIVQSGLVIIPYDTGEKTLPSN